MQDPIASRVDRAAYIRLTELVLCARQYLAQHYAEPLAVRSIARSIGCSLRTLQRAFRVAQDCTPRAMLACVRAAEAGRAVAEGEKLEVAALSVRYAGKQSVIRAIRRCYGLMPSEYRKALEDRTPVSFRCPRTGSHTCGAVSVTCTPFEEGADVRRSMSGGGRQVLIRPFATRLH